MLQIRRIFVQLSRSPRQYKDTVLPNNNLWIKLLKRITCICINICCYLYHCFPEESCRRRAAPCLAEAAYLNEAPTSGFGAAMIPSAGPWHATSVLGLSHCPELLVVTKVRTSRRLRDLPEVNIMGRHLNCSVPTTACKKKVCLVGEELINKRAQIATRIPHSCNN
jgi:hypothetical protein